MQHAVDTKAYATLLAARFDMDIAGALLEGVLQQPIDDAHNVRVVGVRFLVCGAKVEQVLDAGSGPGDFQLAGAVDRTGDIEKLPAQVADAFRAGDYPLDLPFEDVGQVALPAAYKRLRTGHRHAVGIHRDCKYAVALGKCCRHQGGNVGCINAHRVDAQVGLASIGGQPLAQPFQLQHLARLARVGQPAAGDDLQRMVRVVGGWHNTLGVFGVDDVLCNQCIQQGNKVEWAILCERGHGASLQVGYGLPRLVAAVLDGRAQGFPGMSWLSVRVVIRRR